MVTHCNEISTMENFLLSFILASALLNYTQGHMENVLRWIEDVKVNKNIKRDKKSLQKESNLKTLPMPYVSAIV